MKKIRIVISSLITGSMLIVPVMARAATNPPATQTETINERVTKYKKSLKTQPTVAEQAKLKANCKAAQVKGRILTTQINQKVVARSAAYVAITKKIDDLVTELKASNVNTAELETQRDALQKLITTYGNDLKIYQENIADMNAIDCLTDPVGFKAALEAARTSQATVLKDIKGIRTYINDTIKPTLADIKNNSTNGSAQ